jgi:hypothetical protein
VTYDEVADWTKRHGGRIGKTANGGDDHVWNIRTAAMSLCGLWPGPDRTRAKGPGMCCRCAGIVRAIREDYEQLEGGTARWP